jgi:hypothetical protein
MAMRDVIDEVDLVLSLSPAARVNGTFNGTSVDLRGFDSAMFVLNFGAYTDGTHTAAAQHSDDGSSFVAVPANELSAAFNVVSSVAGANTTQRVGYMGGRRFLRLVLTVTGATTGALSEASIVRADPHRAG